MIFFDFETIYKNTYVVIRDKPSDIGTEITPKTGKIMNRANILITLPTTYAIPVYLVSLDMLIPEFAIGNNKYRLIGIQSNVTYLDASKYKVLLNNTTTSFDNRDKLIETAVKMTIMSVYNFFTSDINVGRL